AADGAFAFGGARVVGEGRYAGQCGDALAVGFAQLGQVGGQGSRDGGADAGDALQQSVEVLEVVVGVDDVADLLVQRGDLLVQGLDHRVDALECRLGEGGAAAVGLLGFGGGELAAAGHQVAQL